MVWGDNVTYYTKQFKLNNFGSTHCYVKEEARGALDFPGKTGSCGRAEISTRLCRRYQLTEVVVLVDPGSSANTRTMKKQTLVKALSRLTGPRQTQTTQ